jgi:hypothetical protein
MSGKKKDFDEIDIELDKIETGFINAKSIVIEQDDIVQSTDVNQKENYEMNNIDINEDEDEYYESCTFDILWENLQKYFENGKNLDLAENMTKDDLKEFLNSILK